ncbi:DNA polymerase III subunit gamma/tau [Jiella sp. MQZ9-1]|uniref:DNA polymerase III subunit gamma/tau n=1 Tax=Jiella flava TaxID=2816857 RepID=A0A939FYJ5_9HYPH|nr:DNA polymerase III subunit gamma/tau [Jiella flava]MBO0662368.1 DNA polymerase III subunit gamma/tau [Jiella flava]MCD2470801.1 DNA polymerase III subunit gamma/tau [Jiella flava]
MSETEGTETNASASGGKAEPYRVLARKYRPLSFDDLIGQEPMVRTLTNAFETGRIAQAWMLTGVRGVGKTTTARILARALNYETDTIHEPTIHMPEPGVHCQAIMEGRHVDVVEMDAASHTGIDDVREIIAQVRYRPVSARYKVYIIDEVHMLSNQAFNGLLKTLEEPPEHVKFVFATTEIRKVPITVLSRCQRFDLRRVESATLIAHLQKIADQEHVAIEEDALRLVARAAEGSVRDSLSLMDQAIAHGAGTVTALAVREMLGLADRVRIIDLFETLMAGDAAGALTELREQYVSGADPAIVIAELADFTHLVTTLRYVPESTEDAAISPVEAERGLALSKQLSIRTLGQVWQMLLKAAEELRHTTTPRQAAEMALIRIAHAADLPSPDDLLRMIRDGDALPDQAASSAPRGGHAGNDGHGGEAAGPSASAAAGAASPTTPRLVASASGGGGARMEARPRPQVMPAAAASEPIIGSIEALVKLAEDKRDSLMRVSIRRYIRPVRFQPGRIEVALTDEAPPTLIGDLMKRLHLWTGQRWVVSVASSGGAPTLDEHDAAKRASLIDDAANDPEVAAILAAFPGAKITNVTLRGEVEDAAETTIEALEDDFVSDPDELPDED